MVENNGLVFGHPCFRFSFVRYYRYFLYWILFVVIPKLSQRIFFCFSRDWGKRVTYYFSFYAVSFITI